MKKIVLFFIFIVLNSICFSQEKGDSLAILYRRVYAYKNPADLSTRYNKNPFSYLDKNKLVFISKSEEHPKYFQAKTVTGDTIFVKAKYVSADQTLSHAQIWQDIQDGKRTRTYGEISDLTDILPAWAFWGIWLLLVFLLWRFWKRYSRFDKWFCNKTKSRAVPMKKAWFITYSALAGLVAGSVLLFASQEFKWFLQEGFQIWGKYPSNWDWVMWGSYVGVVMVIIAGSIQSFQRFSGKYAVIYSILVLVLSFVYFVIGMLISVFVIVITVIMNMGSGSGGKSGGSGSSGSYNSGAGNGPVRTKEYFYDDAGDKWEKNSGGDWEKKGLL